MRIKFIRRLEAFLKNPILKPSLCSSVLQQLGEYLRWYWNSLADWHDIQLYRVQGAIEDPKCRRFKLLITHFLFDFHLLYRSTGDQTSNFRSWVGRTKVLGLVNKFLLHVPLACFCCSVLPKSFRLLLIVITFIHSFLPFHIYKWIETPCMAYNSPSLNSHRVIQSHFPSLVRKFVILIFLES